MLKVPRHLLAVVVAVLSLPSAGAQTIAFEPEVRYPLGHVPEPLAVGDLNGDDNLDVVVSNTSSDGEPGGNSVSVLIGNGDATFTRLGDVAVGAERPEGVTLVKINNDAFLDVVTSNYASNSISVLLGKGDGTFETPLVIAVPGGPRFVVGGDFDSDGVTDLATANYDANTVSILKGYDDGRFTISTSIPVGRGPEMLIVAKLTPDSLPDLVTCNRLDDSITPLQGNGDGSFTPGEPYEVGDEPRFLVAADLNGDGIDDVIVANNSSHTITLEKNEGSLTFSRANTLSFTNTSIILREPVYLALADMNGDGDDDILVTWAASDVFTVFPQAVGAFNYGDPSGIKTGSTPLGIAAADFDRDGDMDVIVSNALEDAASVYVSYQTNPGVIVDNGTPGTQALGPWSASDAAFGFGPSSLFSKDGTRYIWEALVPEAGQYEVLLWWTVVSTRSTAVPMEVRHADGSTGVLVDQTKDIGVWHSLGLFNLTDTCKVTLTAPQDTKSVSADAIRLRKVEGAPAVQRGSISVESLARPKGYRIGNSTVLAFQGRLTAQNAGEGEDLVAAIFAPVGPGNESDKIALCKLFIDSNQNGVFDSADQQLGPPRSFASDIRTVVFDGFRETIPDGSTAGLFVIAELAPAGVVARNEGPSAQPALALAGALAALLLMRRKLRTSLSLSAAVVLVGLGLFLPLSGCKGGGGGGGSRNLQLELTSVVVQGQSTSTPSVNAGLPATGWRF